MTKPKILICIPSIDRQHPDNQRCLEHLDTGAVDFDLFRTRRVVIDAARNIFVKEALDASDGYTHLLMIDDDMQFMPWSLNMMLERQRPIVAGLFFTRTLPVKTCAFMRDDSKPSGYSRVSPDVIYAAEAQQAMIDVDAVGAGMVLIETEALRTIKQHDPQRPFFLFEHSPDGQVKVSEDIYFCRRARAAGVPISIDTRVKVGHIGDYVFGWDDFLAARPQWESWKRRGVNQ